MNTRIDAQYWMRIAVEIAKAATCRADVGCVLIHKNIIVGHGYVGSVHGDDHCIEPESDLDPNHVLVKVTHRGSTKTNTTCIRTVHAEVNAALKCTVRGSEHAEWIDAYCTYQPCLDCTKVLLQIGVRKMYYLNAYKDEWRDLYMEECQLSMHPHMTDEKRKHAAAFIKVTL